MNRIGLLAVALSVVASIYGCGRPPEPSASSTASPCALLSQEEISAALPAIALASPGREETGAQVHSCRWGSLVLSLGPHQALVDQTGETSSSGEVRIISGLGTDAVGDQTADRVVIYVRTDRGAFGLTASAYQGVTIDSILPLARLVSDRL